MIIRRLEGLLEDLGNSFMNLRKSFIDLKRLGVTVKKASISPSPNIQVEFFHVVAVGTMNTGIASVSRYLMFTKGQQRWGFIGGKNVFTVDRLKVFWKRKTYTKPQSLIFRKIELFAYFIIDTHKHTHTHTHTANNKEKIRKESSEIWTSHLCVFFCIGVKLLNSVQLKQK